MYILANLAWRAFNRMIIGVEYVPGQRWDRDGTKGYANRLMFTLNYGF